MSRFLRNLFAVTFLFVAVPVWAVTGAVLVVYGWGASPLTFLAGLCLLFCTAMVVLLATAVLTALQGDAEAER